jgi:hydrogenase nickel incorporation protein HypA/HybF
MPHEVDMTKVLISTLREWHAEQPTPLPVRRVRLVVGKFTCVEPDLLRTAFARQRKGTFLEQAELSIRESAFIAYCQKCRREYHPSLGLQYACPLCQEPLNEVRSGRELKIEGVDWDTSTPKEQIYANS